MISLLFALLTLAMILALLNKRRISYVVFAIALVLSIYWLDFHATDPLTINL